MIRRYISVLFVFVAFSGYAQNRYADSLKAVLATCSKPMERFVLLNKIEMYRNFMGNNGDLDSGYIMQMLDIAFQLKSDSLKAISYDWIGDYYVLKDNDYATSLSFLLKGIPLAEKTNNKFILSDIYTNISLVYFFLNNPTEVLNNAQKAEAALPDKSAPMYNYALMAADNDFGNYYDMTNNPDRELHYYQAINEINRSEKMPSWDVGLMDCFGCTYSKLGDTTLSVTYFKKGIEMAILYNNFYELCNLKNDFTEDLVKRKKLSYAKEEAIGCYLISKEHQIKYFQRMAAGWLKEIYDKMNRPDSAYYYSKIESALRDSVFNQDKMTKVQAMAFSEQIRLREEDAKRDEDREQRKQNVQYALIALGIIIFVILFLLLSRSFITNTKMIQLLGVMGLLIVFEFLNLLLHPFLERITHHTPLLMLLALVCIAALLVPLHHRLEKWATHKLIEKNKQIRLAAAKKTIEKLERNKADQ